MKAVFGVLGLLLVVAVMGLLAKKQLAGLSGVGVTPGIAAGASAPLTTPQPTSQQLQNQVRRSVEDAMKQARPQTDEK